MAKKMSPAELRQAIVDSVSASDVEKIMRTLVRLAANGDVQAAKLVLERTAGRPAAAPAQHQHLHIPAPNAATVPAGTGRVLAATVLARLNAEQSAGTRVLPGV